MKPRVVQLTNGLARGGAEMQVVRLACGLRDRGWDVDVVSMLPPAAFERDLRAAGVPLHTLGMTAGKAGAGAFARFAALLRRLRPQVLHSHLFHANMLARAARLVCPVPVNISTVHSMAESGRKSDAVRWRDRIYRFSAPLADVMAVVSEAARTRHVEAKAARLSKTCVVPNGVDTSEFRPDEARRDRTRKELGVEGRFVWLAAGRLMWKKDFANLLRAFGRTQAGVLLLAGEGPDEERLRAIASESGKEVRFLGLREDMPALMNAADAFALSSVVEGLPVVLLEAAASGLPCVACDAGGVRDAVADGVTGFVVPSQNEVALANAMSQAAGMNGMARAAMGAASRKHALARFDWPVVVREWERLYLELMVSA